MSRQVHTRVKIVQLTVIPLSLFHGLFGNNSKCVVCKLSGSHFFKVNVLDKGSHLWKRNRTFSEGASKWPLMTFMWTCLYSFRIVSWSNSCHASNELLCVEYDFPKCVIPFEGFQNDAHQTALIKLILNPCDPSRCKYLKIHSVSSRAFSCWVVIS